MKNTMKRAHEIKTKAANKFNCKPSEIVFSICLDMAWGERTMEAKTLKVATRYTVKENLENAEIVDVQITSDFQYTLRKIKGLAGRKFDSERKVWTIPSVRWEYELSEIAN